MTNDLAARLDRLEAIQDITKLKHTYWHYNDVGLLGDKIAPLFTEDGVWSNAELGHYEGREAIRTFFNYAQLGRITEARNEIDSLNEVDPKFLPEVWQRFREFNFPDALIRQFLDGLRKVGLVLPDEPPLTH